MCILLEIFFNSVRPHFSFCLSSWCYQRRMIDAKFSKNVGFFRKVGLLLLLLPKKGTFSISMATLEAHLRSMALWKPPLDAAFLHDWASSYFHFLFSPSFGRKKGSGFSLVHSSSLGLLFFCTLIFCLAASGSEGQNSFTGRWSSIICYTAPQWMFSGSFFLTNR